MNIIKTAVKMVLVMIIMMAIAVLSNVFVEDKSYLVTGSLLTLLTWMIMWAIARIDELIGQKHGLIRSHEEDQRQSDAALAAEIRSYNDLRADYQMLEDSLGAQVDMSILKDKEIDALKKLSESRLARVNELEDTIEGKNSNVRIRNVVKTIDLTIPPQQAKKISEMLKAYAIGRKPSDFTEFVTVAEYSQILDKLFDNYNEEVAKDDADKVESKAVPLSDKQ